MKKFNEKDLLELVGKKSFEEIAFQYLLGRIPEKKEVQVLSELMTLVIDHGEDSPSAQATIAAAKSGEDVLRSVEHGIHEINNSHGGAIEGCAYLLSRDDFNAGEVVQAVIAVGGRVPGFGHRLYKDEDPRATFLESRIKHYELSSVYFDRAREIERELEILKGKKFILNIDAAIASVLCSLDIKPELMNAFFLFPRVAGLVYQWSTATSNK